VTEKTAGTRLKARAGEQTAGTGAATEFERLYRANVDAVTAYFARRTADPQLVADLTADTFVAVITGFESFDPRKGTARAWLFGIAGHVYASYCRAYSLQQHKLQRLAGRRDLDQDQLDDLLERIDAERAGRGLIAELARLPERDRAVIELVDLAGLRPAEAAAALGLTPGTVRMRLMRARARLRKLSASARGAPANAGGSPTSTGGGATGRQMATGSAVTNQIRSDGK
jgi:RNA polymerase sigma-70 factor (ECF subfamily)